MGKVIWAPSALDDVDRIAAFIARYLLLLPMDADFLPFPAWLFFGAGIIIQLVTYKHRKAARADSEAR